MNKQEILTELSRLAEQAHESGHLDIAASIHLMIAVLTTGSASDYLNYLRYSTSFAVQEFEETVAASKVSTAHLQKMSGILESFVAPYINGKRH
jgi:hypothetical protein